MAARRHPVHRRTGRSPRRVQAPEGRRCLYERRYPAEDLASHVVGQWSLHFGKTGLEVAYNTDLVGEPVPARSLTRALRSRVRASATRSISTIDTRLQKEALEALAGRRGGVVALNPKTGAVYVAASNPTYDPNPLASNDRLVAEQARCELGIGLQAAVRRNASAKTPTANRPVREPGGAAAVRGACRRAVRPGRRSRSSRRPRRSSPGSTRRTRTRVGGSSYTRARRARDAIGNYGGGSCGGSLANALRCRATRPSRRSPSTSAPTSSTPRRRPWASTSGGAADFVGCDADADSDIDETRTGCLPRELKRAGRDESRS